MRISVIPAVLVLWGLLSGAPPAQADDAAHDLVGAWDIFSDSCRSGYLEYRADGGFGQVYRRDRSSWIADPVWGAGRYRVDGDMLFSSERKLDGDLRIEAKKQFSFDGPDRLQLSILEMVWIDEATNRVRAIDSFTEEFARCAPSAIDAAAPARAAIAYDPALLVGRWGWVRGCATGYAEYTRDGRIWIVEQADGEDSGNNGGDNSGFDYGFYEIQGRTLLEVYAYETGIWKSESNYAFDDRGRLFFSDGMNPTWSDKSGATEDGEPFFEILFNCAEEVQLVEEPPATTTAAPDATDLDALLYDSDVDRMTGIIAESRIRCADQGTPSVVAADCINYVWSMADVSGDGLLSLAEIARGLRMVAKWSTDQQARDEQAPLDSDTKLGVHVLGVFLSPFGAKPLLESYDYDDDGKLSREELFADTDFADALALSQKPLTESLDIDSILEKLRLILEMTRSSSE